MPNFHTTVRGLTKFKTRRSLSDEYDGQLRDWIDEKMSICSSTPQDHWGYTNSSLLESDLKVRKYHAA